MFGIAGLKQWQASGAAGQAILWRRDIWLRQLSTSVVAGLGDLYFHRATPQQQQGAGLASIHTKRARPNIAAAYVGGFRKAVAPTTTRQGMRIGASRIAGVACDVAVAAFRDDAPSALRLQAGLIAEPFPLVCVFVAGCAPEDSVS